jgi:hypothetical protein
LLFLFFPKFLLNGKEGQEQGSRKRKAKPETIHSCQLSHKKILKPKLMPVARKTQAEYRKELNFLYLKLFSWWIYGPFETFASLARLGF